MRRFYFITVFLLVIVTPGYAYLGLRLADGGLGWGALVIPFGLILLGPFLLGRLRGKRSRLQSVLGQLTFFSMGLLSFLLVNTLIIDAICALTGVSFESGLVFGLTTAALVIGHAQAFSPRVRKVVLRFEGLKSELDKLVIAQITDLHVGNSIGARYVQRVVEKTNALKPHFVMFTGDIGDGRFSDCENEIGLLAGVKASAGIFYVPGNHEYYWNCSDWINGLSKLGYQALLNQSRQVEVCGAKVFVAGIIDPAAAQMGGGLRPDVLAAAPVGSEEFDSSALRILLSHRPGFAEPACERGFDIQLSGHTHGGQFFPWTLVVPFVHKHSLGLYRLGRMWLYVSPGTGSWGPLLRLGTRPEITLFELRRA